MSGSGCSLVAPERHECTWQGSDAFDGYSASASVTVTGDEVSAFSVVGHAAMALDRPEGSCAFDLASVAPAHIERRADGMFRIVNERKEGQFYLGAKVGSDRVSIELDGVPCSAGRLPHKVHIPLSGRTCQVAW